MLEEDGKIEDTRDKKNSFQGNESGKKRNQRLQTDARSEKASVENEVEEHSALKTSASKKQRLHAYKNSGQMY